MSLAFELCRLLSILAFLFYGVTCIWGTSMVPEFERFGLAKFRVLTGALEVLGALGLLVSYAYTPLAVLAGGGLALLMVLGTLTRVRIRDPLLDMLPAVVLLLVNAFVAGVAVRGL